MNRGELTWSKSKIASRLERIFHLVRAGQVRGDISKYKWIFPTWRCQLGETRLETRLGTIKEVKAVGDWLWLSNRFKSDYIWNRDISRLGNITHNHNLPNQEREDQLWDKFLGFSESCTIMMLILIWYGGPREFSQGLMLIGWSSRYDVQNVQKKSICWCILLINLLSEQSQWLMVITLPPVPRLPHVLSCLEPPSS